MALLPRGLQRIPLSQYQRNLAMDHLLALKVKMAGPMYLHDRRTAQLPPLLVLVLLPNPCRTPLRRRMPQSQRPFLKNLQKLLRQANLLLKYLSKSEFQLELLH
jgi:hypothetical protein